MHLFKEENVQTTYPKRKPTKPASQCLIVRLVGNNGVAHQRHVQHGAPGSSGRKNSKPYGKISTHPLAEEETGPYPFRAWSLMKNTTRPVGKGSTPPAVAYLHKSDKAIAMVPLRGTKAEEKYHGPASCWRRIAEVNHKPGFVLHET